MTTLRNRIRAGARRLRFALECRWPRPRALILLYHRVTTLPTDPHGLCTSPERFSQHLEIIRRHATPVPLREIQSGVHGGLALTFDDGYLDNLTAAAPLLQIHGIPATYFVTAGPRDEEYWWDRLDGQLLQRSEDRPWHREWRCWDHPPTAAAREYVRDYWRLRTLPLSRHAAGPRAREAYRVLTLEELRELAARPGADIGCHTMAHECLPLLTGPEQREEVLAARRALGDALGRPVTGFAYPYGAYNRASVEAVEAAGFAYACSARAGVVRGGSCRWLLPRVCADGMEPERLADLLRSVFR